MCHSQGGGRLERVQQVKALTAKPDCLGLRWWEDRTGCCKLSSDFHTSTVAYECAYAHTHGGGVVINEFVKEDRDDGKIAQG